MATHAALGETPPSSTRFTQEIAMNPIIKEITEAQIKKGQPAFKVGDGVRVHTKVREGDKERIQIYSGIVIARTGHAIHETFTLRLITYGEAVSPVFPFNSP